MEDYFSGTSKIGLESGDTSYLSSLKSPVQSRSRGWNVLHYACQLRRLSSIHSILSNPKPITYLSSPDLSERRPCDLLPSPELSFFSLYSWGVGSDYQLGYPKDKQLQPKKIDLRPSIHPAE